MSLRGTAGVTLPSLQIHVLDESSVSRELDLVSELFHRINRIIPENQVLFTLPPEMKAREAVALLRQKHYSQAPVVVNGEVMGVFSFRSFARVAASPALTELNQHKAAPGDWLVEECTEKFKFASVTDEMLEVFDAMDRDNGVLVGTESKPQGILTQMDFLRYLYEVASPFVMVSEAELTLRALIQRAVGAELPAFADRALRQLYGEGKVPAALEAMTFDNYRLIISHGQNWDHFEAVFGGTRLRTAAKLKQLCDLRNDLFHFKRKTTMEDHQTLGDLRNWLLTRAKLADARRTQASEK